MVRVPGGGVADRQPDAHPLAGHRDVGGHRLPAAVQDGGGDPVHRGGQPQRHHRWRAADDGANALPWAEDAAWKRDFYKLDMTPEQLAHARSEMDSQKAILAGKLAKD